MDNNRSSKTTQQCKHQVSDNNKDYYKWEWNKTRIQDCTMKRNWKTMLDSSVYLYFTNIYII